ncbi:uncharacterized protein LOC111696756 isoform X2 [Eurytemora carolleeae]|uniref:uncharacterized protein LOC111696756 isoform X2 n=1 Tax=Eurytemora carolleeae TaxID=1294199 RepID=UPI000C772C7A|nr:uncharacterized protein LOC111696756 isoform X2 [Eurytemora carolleeae]|eukprot:XP_023322253.1 uncharacterized protein LOC111696756 isoform X2 [Eurytemora affinis]
MIWFWICKVVSMIWFWICNVVSRIWFWICNVVSRIWFRIDKNSNISEKMGLTWDLGFIKTMPGIAKASEVVVGVIGGITGIILASGFESFLFWTTVIISGTLLFTHITNLTPMIEAKFPFFMKLHLIYLGLWSALLVLDLILCIIGFKLILVVVIALLLAFLVDLFIMYRKWRSVSVAAPPPPGSPAAAETGGKF